MFKVTPKKRLLFVMGAQRSGTNALRRSLSLDPHVAGFNERKSSDFFDNWHLRREPVIRKHIHAMPGVVLLKPLKFHHDSLGELIAEFSRYDLHIAWIYRDPANVYHSTVTRWPYLDDVSRFIKSWNETNLEALGAARDYPELVTIVRYEELIHDPKTFRSLCRHLGVEGENLFQRDSRGGYTKQPAEVRERIHAGTADVWAKLEAARRFPGRAVPAKQATPRQGATASRDGLDEPQQLRHENKYLHGMRSVLRRLKPVARVLRRSPSIFRASRRSHPAIDVDCDLPDGLLRVPLHAITRAHVGRLGDRIEFRVEGHTYLSSAPSVTQPSSDPLVRFAPDTRYSLAVDCEATGGSASLWIIEFDRDAKQTNHRVALRSGTAMLSFATSPAHLGATLALRLSGSGSVRLGRISIRAVPTASDAP